MKRVPSYMKSNSMEDRSYMDFEEYEEMFQDGYSDSEISMEFGVNEDFVKKLRDEYQKDY